MMISTKKLADAVTARACDSCIKKRARWYCAADDAFLCQACDSSVHSANLLARRHERVRLIKTEPRSEEPLWHSGFKTKPRTPRKSKLQKNPVLLVPEMGQDDNSFEENDEQEQLLYRVPILDPFGESNMNTEEIESLLGKGLDFDMETLGFLDNGTGKESLRSCCRNTETVKLKEEEVNNIGTEIDITFEMNFDDYDKSVANETCMENEEFDDDLKGKKKKNILLALNYEEVISAWTDKKTPWITGDGPPELDLNHCWPPACMDVCGRVDNYLPAYGEMGNITTAADGGREARVLRYREKRRRRLFSKKIRYEVRKLNAEKRPRMKGRFVKRSSNFAPT